MRRTIFGLAASFAFLFLCNSAEARGHHSSYRHINSRGHVSYYHGHGGGHHYAGIPISTPTAKPHKYLYRYTCFGTNGPHYCYKYPSNHIGLHEGGYVPDAPPASSVNTPVPNSDDEIQHLASELGATLATKSTQIVNSEIPHLARELGATATARVWACNESAEMFDQAFDNMLTGTSTHAMSALSESTLKYFSEGLHSQPVRNKSCAATKDNYGKATVRFYSALFTGEGHPERIYDTRLGAARYEKMCSSAELREEGDRISAEMLAKLGLTADVLPTLAAKESEYYAKSGDLGCITAARIARW